MSPNNAEYQMPSYNDIPNVPIDYGNERLIEQATIEKMLQDFGNEIEAARKEADLGAMFPERKESIFRKFAVMLIGTSRPTKNKELTEADLMEIESSKGAEITGNDQAPEERKFFYERDHNWFYSLMFKDEQGKVQTKVYRYEVSDEHVLMIEDGGGHTPIHHEEKRRLLAIVTEYHRRVMSEVYQVSPQPETIDEVQFDRSVNELFESVVKNDVMPSKDDVTLAA